MDNWYHGSPLKLSTLRSGSTITSRIELARIFSHKPAVVSMEDDGRIRHNGDQPGYLYRIAESLAPGDVLQHPNTSMGPGDEWLTTRELRLELLGETEVRPDEFLSAAEIDALRRR